MSVSAVLSDLRRFVSDIKPDLPAVDEALPHVRAMMRAVGQPYLLVGGIAVIRHGYLRYTKDIDVLMSAAAASALDGHLAAFGFKRERRTRLRHIATDVEIDLLIAGDPMPRPGDPPVPDPTEHLPSNEEADVIGIVGLVTLKLIASRRQDEADIIELLKKMNEGEYIELEAALPPIRRRAVLQLRDAALQELAWSLEAQHEGE